MRLLGLKCYKLRGEKCRLLWWSMLRGLSQRLGPCRVGDGVSRTIPLQQQAREKTVIVSLAVTLSAWALDRGVKHCVRIETLSRQACTTQNQLGSC